MASGDRGGTSLVADLSSFPITGRWPATHPERLQLYSVDTPNGVHPDMFKGHCPAVTI